MANFLHVYYTIFWILEEGAEKWIFGCLHQLHDALLDGILVFVEPALGVVTDLCKENMVR